MDADGLKGRVVRVVDGDSIYLAGVDKQIRLFGVDAPERDEPLYAEAKEYLNELVYNQTLQCTIVEYDKYERIIGRCFLDGTEINERLIKNGPSTEYCRFSKNFYGTC